jgi:hypothetical protein
MVRHRPKPVPSREAAPAATGALLRAIPSGFPEIANRNVVAEVNLDICIIEPGSIARHVWWLCDRIGVSGAHPDEIDSPCYEIRDGFTPQW